MNSHSQRGIRIPFAAICLMLALSGPGAAEPLAAAQQVAPRPWPGPDGQPLPLASDAEIEYFLRNAEIVEVERIPIGVTDPLRVTLEMDGVRAHAVFRHLKKVYPRKRMSDGRLRFNLKDNCKFEAAAYKLSRLLGMDNVPPVVERRVRGRSGTLQMWVYNALMEGERSEQNLRPPDMQGWARQMHLMYLFDGLTGNDDRNKGNILIDPDWKVWLIDHTRAFYARAQPKYLHRVAYVDRTFWERLQGLDKSQLEKELGDYLSRYEIARILSRRDKLVDHIKRLIDGRGAEAVLYDSPALLTARR